MAPRNVAIGREIPISGQHASALDSTDPMPKPITEKRGVGSLIQPGQNLSRARCVPPVAHQVAHDAEHADELHSRGLHAHIRCFGDEMRRNPAGFDVGPDRVTFCTEGEGSECRACIRERCQEWMN